MNSLLSRVMIVGSGRVGGLLAALVEELGGKVVLLTTQSAERVPELQKRFLNSAVIRWSSSDNSDTPLAEVFDDAPTLLLLAVRDDALGVVVERLVSLRSQWNDTAVVHCSGTTALQVLDSFRDRGAKTAVLHPCYPIVSNITASERSQMAWVVEANSSILSSTLATVVARWGARGVIVDEINRSLYHASQVIGAGHLVALLSLVENLLVESNLSPEQARIVLRSLLSGVQNNLRDANDIPLKKFLTGPFVRGDISVIDNHLAALDVADPDARLLYELLGRITSSLM